MNPVLLTSLLFSLGMASEGQSLLALVKQAGPNSIKRANFKNEEDVLSTNQEKFPSLREQGMYYISISKLIYRKMEY